MGAKVPPRLKPGEIGTINTRRLPARKDGKPAGYEANAWIGQPSDAPRRVHRRGRTARQAEANLKAALKEIRDAAEYPDLVETVEELLQLWVKSLEAKTRAPGQPRDGQKTITRSTAESHKREVENHLLPRVREPRVLRISETKTSDLNRVLERIRLEVSPSAAKNARGRLMQAFAWAKRFGYAKDNPAAETEIDVAPTPQKPVAPSAQDVERLRAVLIAQLERSEGGPKSPAPYLAFEIMAGTGARLGEVCALDWSDIDFDKGTITFTDTVVEEGNRYHLRGHLKNGDTERKVYVPERLLALLGKHRKESGPVIAARRMKRPEEQRNLMIAPTSIRGSWRTAYRRADVPPEQRISPHALRKHVATVLAREIGVEKAAEQLGDSLAVALKHYVEPTTEGPSEAADILGR